MIKIVNMLIMKIKSRTDICSYVSQLESFHLSEEICVLTICSDSQIVVSIIRTDIDKNRSLGTSASRIHCIGIVEVVLHIFK